MFAGSVSSHPVVFGQYSPKLFAILTLTALGFFAVLLKVLIGKRNTIDHMSKKLGRFAAAGYLLEFTAFTAIPLCAILAWIGDRFTPIAGEAGFILGIALVISGAVLGALTEAGKERSRLFAKHGGMTLLSVLFGVFLLEITLHLTMPFRIFNPALDLRPNVRIQLQNGELPGVSRTGVFSTNRWGMRGEEPPDEWDEWFTVVCIGGSTTRCFVLDDSRTWPWLLQEDLRLVNPSTWVGNGGVDGHSTIAHVVFMEEVIPRVRPDMVIFLIGINEKYNFDLGMNLENRITELQDSGLGQWLFRNSRIYQTAYYLKQAYFDEIPIIGDSWPFRMNTEPMPEPEMELPDDLNDLLIDPDLTTGNLRRMIELAREYGATPVILTQPLLYEDTPYWASIKDNNTQSDRGYISSATLSRMVDITNQSIIGVCHEMGAHCYDLASAVPHDPELFYDGMHFTEAGAELIADSVNAFLLRNDLVPAPVR